VNSSELRGKKVVLTGTFVTMKRDEAEELLAGAGALVVGSISRSTDLLVCGENAGSKLAKAQSLGVAVLREAEMVALLVKAGSGAERLAGAAEELARVEAAAPPASPVVAAVAELRAFVETLKKRADVRVSVARVGRRASRAELAQLKQKPPLPAELIALYTEMNGLHVEWEFVEPPGGGCMRIPPVTQWTRFTGDDKTYMGFDDDQEALLLDEIQAEGGTWLVRGKKKGGEARLVFASAAEGSEGITPAPSIAAYLREAMAHGFVYYWPRCGRENRYVSYADQEAALARFRALPEKPTAFRTGARVHFEFFSEGGRGELLSRHEAPASRDAEFCGRKLAQVKLDEGTVAWLPEKWMKVVKKADAYERLRAPGFDLQAAMKADLPALLADLARAIGPLEHYSSCNVGGYPSNGRRAAGLLSALPLGEAISLVLDLHEAVGKAKLPLGARRPLPKSGQEFSASQLSRVGFSFAIDELFTGLFGGLWLLICHASAREGRPGKALVGEASIARLSKVPVGESLARSLAEGEQLAAPAWYHDAKGETEKKLGLPAGAILLQGTGF
jgi:hypothetical protein